MLIKPALKYRPADDLCVITSYYNPAGYQTRLANYLAFEASLRQSGITLFTIELAFGSQPHVLLPGPQTVQVRGSGIMWQKERMLNILLDNLPANYRKVVWADCDIFFDNEFWAPETAKLLEDKYVVQPFAHVIKLPRFSCSATISPELFAQVTQLPRNPLLNTEAGELFTGFCKAFSDDKRVLAPQKWFHHGHTGYAWAARREVLERIGLYDVSLAGNADHLMAHSFCGDWQSDCIDKLVGKTGELRKHYQEWSRKAYELVEGNIGYVSGAILHWWHGETAARAYHQRSSELLAMNFNPTEDLLLDEQQLWVWKDVDSPLNQWGKEYFESRKEDG